MMHSAPVLLLILQSRVVTIVQFTDVTTLGTSCTQDGAVANTSMQFRTQTNLGRQGHMEKGT
eukprot:1657737-Amphidinium_carterae.1